MMIADVMWRSTSTPANGEIDDTRDATEILRARVPDADILVLTHIDISTGYVGGIPRGVFD